VITAYIRYASTGSIYLTLWDDSIDAIEEDMVLKLDNAYVNVFRGSMRLNLGRYGSFSVLDETPFEDVELENNISDQQVEYQRRPYRRGENRGRDNRRRY
jgi:replication factor A1